MFGSFSKLPGGNVHCSRFVKLQTDGTVIEAGANDDTWGISQPSTLKLALAGWDDGLCGVVGGPPINVYGPGDDEAPLELGGTVAIGDRIKPGAAGVGVKCTADGDRAAAVALHAGVNGDIIPVKPHRLDLAS